MKQLISSATAYKILTGDVRGNTLSHAYMLVFPDKRNLLEALKIFALGFFGAEEDSPLGRRILHGSYPDCKFYGAEEKSFNADGASELLEDCAMRPVEGDKKLNVICNFDGVSALVQNKLLKTLEEPQRGVHFLLGVCSLFPVLDTVKSRVKILEIPPFTPRQIYCALEREEHREINKIASESAGGVLGNAQNIAEGGWFQEVSAGAREALFADNLEKVAQTALKLGNIKYKNELLSEMQRQYFSALTGGIECPLSSPALVFALDKIPQAFADLKFNANFQGLIYDFMLEVCKENKKWQKL